MHPASDHLPGSGHLPEIDKVSRPHNGRRNQELFAMIWKAIKVGVLSTAAAAVVGGIVFGSDLGSYVKSSARCVSTAMKDNVPVEFELRRARDLLDEILPEMQANIRAIAEQEVELTNLKSEIADNDKALADQ